MCDFMQLATLQFEMKLQKCIRMGITTFNQNFIWIRISDDINFGLKIQRYASQNENFEYSYPLIVLLLLLRENKIMFTVDVLKFQTLVPAKKT